MQERSQIRHSDLGIRREAIPYSPLQNKIDKEIRGGMNNFDMHLPYDNDDQPDMNGYRAIKRLVGAWDKKHIDWYREHNTDERTYQYHSLRMLNQTGEEFARTIDEVATCLDINPEDFRRFHRSEDDGGMSRSERSDFKYTEIARVYRRLRTMGYTEYELTR